MGHAADGFSKPRVGWDVSGQYVYSNSQGEGLHAVCVWCIASQRLVARLGVRGGSCAGNRAGSSGGGALEVAGGAHTGPVRDVHCHPTERLLVTASYDHSVKVWRPPPSS